MDRSLFGSELWKPALDKYAEATGLTVELFGVDGERVFGSTHLAPLVALFREYGYEPGLFAECARRSVGQTTDRPAVAVAESHGLLVVGTSLLLDGAIVGAAVAGYALASFVNQTTLQRWAKSAAVPLDRLWSVARQQAPLPERRLMLYGELLQVLGDALLRENHRTRQYEDAVEKLKAAAAAKDEFLAVLSHELRTPLAPIAGWASVLKKTDSLDQVHRGAEAIERNALLQSRMVDELLDMNRITYGKVKLDLEILEVSELIRAAVEASAQHIEEKAIRLELVDAGVPLQVEGDAGRLQQVFRNILDNAAKFTDSGGTIRVSLGREADSAVIVVADTGKGIAPEFLPFVFDIFRQQERGTRRAQEGLGIGLSLVKKLTELHKGTVSIASRGAGHGADVTVRLPLATETVEAADTETVEAANGARLSAASLAGLSVLVVEDSEDTREALRSLLELLGAKVWVARDGREGLEMMLQGASADVVLCDLLMPRLDGFEFVREARSRLLPAHPPVIAMSGLATEASRARSSQAGFVAHIAKPFTEAAVVAAVQAAVEGRRAPQSANLGRLEPLPGS